MGPLRCGFFFSEYIPQIHICLDLQVWNLGNWEPTVKLYAGFPLRGGSVPHPVLFMGQQYLDQIHVIQFTCIDSLNPPSTPPLGSVGVVNPVLHAFPSSHSCSVESRSSLKQAVCLQTPALPPPLLTLRGTLYSLGLPPISQTHNCDLTSRELTGISHLNYLNQSS